MQNTGDGGRRNLRESTNPGGDLQSAEYLSVWKITIWNADSRLLDLCIFKEVE